MVELYTAIVIIFAMVVGGYVVVNYIEYKKKAVNLPQMKSGNKDRRDTHFQDWIDNVPFAKQQLINIYNEQLAACLKQGKTEEEAKPILDPILSKIKLLESVEKYEPVARAGAMIADTGVKALNKALKGIGVAE